MHHAVTQGSPDAFPEDCAYPAILGAFSSGSAHSLNATAAIGAGGSSIALTAQAPAGGGWKALASSYGRGSWVRTAFYSAVPTAGERAPYGPDRLPLLPWFANFSVTNAWSPPSWAMAGKPMREGSVAGTGPQWPAIDAGR